MTDVVEQKPAARRRWTRLAFGNRDRRILGIAPQDDAYRIVVATIAGGKVASLIDLGNHVDDATRLAEDLNDAEWNPKHHDETVFALPRHEVILRYLHLPATDANRIASMVAYEAQAHSPWPIDDTVASHEFLEASDDGYSLVALYLARLVTVNAHLARLADLRLFPTRIEPSTRGMAALLASMPDARLPALYVADGQVCEYVRLSRGHHAYSRGIAGAADPLAVLRESLESDERRHGRDSDELHLVVAGISPNAVFSLPDFDPQSNTVEPAAHAPFAILNGVQNLDAGMLTSVAASVSAIEPEDAANLLPEQQLHRLQLSRTLRQARTFALLVAWLVLVLVGAVYYEHRSLQKRAAVAEQRIAELGPGVLQLRQKNEALRQFQHERAKVNVPLRIVLELYERTPQAMAINSFRYDQRGRLTLGGEARQPNEVFDFIEALEKSPLLTNCKSTNISSPIHSVGNWIEFRAECDIVE